jgi:hypothetical protein
MIIRSTNTIVRHLKSHGRFEFGHEICIFQTLTGADVWPGKQMHSHNYRVPEPFLDQVSMILTVISPSLVCCGA